MGYIDVALHSPIMLPMKSPFFQASGLLKYVGLLLSGVCHQFPEHSFFIAGVQMPLCARCMGTYLGALLGLCASWWRGRSRTSQFPPREVVMLQALFFGVWAIDGLNSYWYFLSGRTLLYTPSNFLRLTAGMLSGLSLSLLALPMFNATVWRNPHAQPIVSSVGEFGLMLLPAMILEGLLQAAIPALYYPFLVVSVISVLLMLTIVNTTILVLLFHRENSIGSWRAAWLPLSLGLALSIAEMSSLALLRYWLAPVLSISLLYRVPGHYTFVQVPQ